MKKMVIIVTVPVVLETWLKGQPKFLSDYYNVEIITAYAPSITKIQSHENVTIKTMDFTREINPLKDIKVLLQLFVYLVRTRPSIVYTLTPKAGLLGMIASWMALISHRVHNIVGLPHLEAKGRRRIILTYTEKITYFFASNLYCNSKNLRTIVATMTNKTVKVIGDGSVNGVDTALFRDTMQDDEKSKVKEALRFLEDDFIITYVGRIVKDKGLNELLDVFDDLSKKHSHIKLLLIGDYKNETDPISRESQIIMQSNKHIKYLEFQDDVKAFLSITNLFVLPSYREGLPNVLIEAGSLGIPMVATDINGCNEVVEDGVNGILVKPKDKVLLFEAIERFVVDKVFYMHIKNAVRPSIIKKYEQHRFWKSLKEMFFELEKEK